jgi:hypothetical protein
MQSFTTFAFDFFFGSTKENNKNRKIPRLWYCKYEIVAVILQTFSTHIKGYLIALRIIDIILTSKNIN